MSDNADKKRDSPRKDPRVTSTARTKIAIVGGGRGGVLVLQAISSLDAFEIVGLADANPDAPGLAEAQKRGIRAETSFEPLLRVPGLTLVIEVTGNEGVRKKIRAQLPEGVSFIDSTAARVIMTMMEAKEQGTAVLREHALRLATTTEELESTTRAFAQTFQDISESAKLLLAHQDAVNKIGDTTRRFLGESKRAIGVIQGLAEETRTLGLNASIEAARMGSASRGFAVVAEEVRKLARNSGSQAKSISSVLLDIDKNLANILKKIEESSAAAQRQVTFAVDAARATEEIRQAVSGLSRLAHELHP